MTTMPGKDGKQRHTKAPIPLPWPLAAGVSEGSMASLLWPDKQAMPRKPATHDQKRKGLLGLWRVPRLHRLLASLPCTICSIWSITCMQSSPSVAPWARSASGPSEGMMFMSPTNEHVWPCQPAVSLASAAGNPSQVVQNSRPCARTKQHCPSSPLPLSPPPPPFLLRPWCPAIATSRHRSIWALRCPTSCPSFFSSFVFFTTS